MPDASRYLALLLLLAMTSTAQAQDPAQLASQATAAYHRGAYAESATLFADAVAHGATNPAIAYNAACSFALDGQTESAFRYLARAIEGGFDDADVILADRDLTSLHGDARWTELIDRARVAHDQYRASLGNPGLRDELLEMARRDQEARNRLGKPGTASELEGIDAANTERLDEILDHHGWPGYSLVGEDGATAAWLLAQHADRAPVFQARCLELMTAAADAGEASKRELAYLTDRVRVAQGEKQVYGTQFFYSNGGMVPQAIEDPANVDARRRSVGLQPLADYQRQLEALNQNHHGHSHEGHGHDGDREHHHHGHGHDGSRRHHGDSPQEDDHESGEILPGGDGVRR